MPFDSNGNFTRVHNWEQDRKDNIDIVSDRHDEEDDNFEGGFNECMLRDGRAAMEGNLKMGNFQVRNMAKGTLPDDAVNKEQLDSSNSTLSSSIKDILNSLYKLGDIKASVQTANHGNWLLCNGQAVSRVTYSSLFSLIGTKFGGGDGTSTFNVPDYRGKFLRGLGGNSASDIYQTQAESLPKIEGTINIAKGSMKNTGILNKSGVFNSSITDSTVSTYNGYDDQVLSTTKASGIVFKASDSSPIYNGSHVTPINQAVNYFIKAKEEA